MSIDVFISYSHRDNLPVNINENGWVDSFHQALAKFLTEHLGRETKIYRDVQNYEPNSQLTKHLEAKLDETIILVPVISPSYLQAKTASEELRYFAGKKNKAFIFPVYKHPVESLPQILGDPIRVHEFYTKDKIKEKVNFIDPSLGKELVFLFNSLVSDLASNIAKFIKENVSSHENKVKDSPLNIAALDRNKSKIYLAEPSPDLWEQYDEIRRDLEQRNYEYIPSNINEINTKSPFPKDFAEKVRQDLSKCDLIIHLLGKENSLYPKASEKSYLHIQTEVASEFDNRSNYKRLIWNPRNLNIEDSEQREFIENIRSSSSENVEFIQNSIEDFKTNIQIALNSKPAEKFIPKSEDPPWIYVLYDDCDIEGASDLEKLLNENGCQTFASKEYIKPLKLGEKIDANEVHKGFLSRCDSVLVYWNQSKSYWVKNSIHDIQKHKAYRVHPYRINAIFCDGDLEREEEKLNLSTFSNFIKVASESISNSLNQNGFARLSYFLSNLEI